MKIEMQNMMKDDSQSQDVQAISVLVQYLAQKKIDVNYVLNQHDLLSKTPSAQTLQENQVAMTTLVYYYTLEK